VTEGGPRSTGARVSRSTRRTLRTLLGVVVVVGAAFAGGLGLASTWESTAANDDYRVSTRLIARSQVEIPTNIGTATFDTHAWGPGGRFAVSALSLPPVERASGSPFIDLPGELADIRALALETALTSLQKFAGGALAGGLVGMLAWQGLVGSGARSRRSRLLAVLVGGSAAAALAVAGWGAGAYLTFDEEFGDDLQADGLLAIGLSADELLGELNSRDQAYAGYVQSLATYIDRLRTEASPAETADVAVRVLLVSDVHGRNVYPQLRSVIESQGVDFVLDAGDLVQWGTGFELSARPDIVAGIESLGVPYVWVKGNHDGSGTVAEMEEIANTVVLDGEVTELAGLSILGVADPRLYQDGGPVEAENPDEVAEMERQAAAAAVAELREPDQQDAPLADLALMHHPAGARELGELSEAPVWVSGHTHEPAQEVEDDHVDLTVGTTGAAGIRTFKGQNEAGDVVPTPQSFDILDFGPTCRPVSLTRFTYPDVLSDAGTARVTYETIRLDEETADDAAQQGAEEAAEDPGDAPGDDAPAERSCG
jgi:predicted phosphodiesterase